MTNLQKLEQNRRASQVRKAAQIAVEDPLLRDY